MLKAQVNMQSKGFTIVELMIAVAVIGILMVIGIPGFQAMARTNQVRNAATAMTSGLQTARAEAIARNKRVEFVLGAGAGSLWTVKLAGGATIKSRTQIDDAKEVGIRTVPATATTVTFNSFGYVAANADASATLTSITADVAGQHGLNVTINGGEIRMCNPRIASGTSPRAC